MAKHRPATRQPLRLSELGNSTQTSDAVNRLREPWTKTDSIVSTSSVKRGEPQDTGVLLRPRRWPGLTWPGLTFKYVPPFTSGTDLQSLLQPPFCLCSHSFPYRLLWPSRLVYEASQHPEPGFLCNRVPAARLVQFLQSDPHALIPPELVGAPRGDKIRKVEDFQPVNAMSSTGVRS
jgi:hypothetical protein